MTLVRWSPMREMMAMQEQMNRLMNDTLGRPADEMDYGTWLPAVDLREEEHRFVLDVELPGMRKEDIEIHLENGILSVRGERRFEMQEKKENYHRIERAYGKFSRSFSLPTRVNAEGIAASYKDGLLEVSVPKAEESKPKKIAIQG